MAGKKQRNSEKKKKMIQLWRQPIDELDRLADKSFDMIAWCQPDIEESIELYTELKSEREADMEAYRDHAEWICGEMWATTAMFQAHAAAMIATENERRDEHEAGLLESINEKIKALDANYRLISDTTIVKYMNHTKNHDYCNVLQIPDLRDIVTSYLVCTYTE